MSSSSPLLRFLVEPESVANLDAEEWSLLFAEARACGLLSKLAEELDRRDSVSVPTHLLPHILAAKRQGLRLILDVRRELQFLSEALGAINAPVLLLKGAAYVAAQLPAAEGRVFSDIDLLVPKRILSEAEGALMLGGWAAHHLDGYDQRYYRQWSHEIPPMVHLQRGTTIDLHHSLVMPTLRIRAEIERMIDEAVPIPGGAWYRLKNEDMVLHAASHLLLNSEFDRGLRDLWDVDVLVRHFSVGAPDFAERVLFRAKEVGLYDMACNAFVLCHRFFRTSLPGHVVKKSGLLLSLLEHAATTRHPDTKPFLQGASDLLLSMRELSLRLPPHLLVRHFGHKIYTTFFARKKTEIKVGAAENLNQFR